MKMYKIRIFLVDYLSRKQPIAHSNTVSLYHNIMIYYDTIFCVPCQCRTSLSGGQFLPLALFNQTRQGGQRRRNIQLTTNGMSFQQITDFFAIIRMDKTIKFWRICMVRQLFRQAADGKFGESY